MATTLENLTAFFAGITSTKGAPEALAAFFEACGVTDPKDFAHTDFGPDVEREARAAEEAAKTPDRMVDTKARLTAGRFKAAVEALRAAPKAAPQAGPAADEDDDAEDKDPMGFKPKKVLRMLAAGRREPALLKAGDAKLPFVLVKVDPATGKKSVDLEKTLETLEDTGWQPPGRDTVQGLKVLKPSQLAEAKASRLEPWDRREKLVLGEDGRRIGWGSDPVLSAPATQAFVVFMRTRSSLACPVANVYDFVRDVRAAGGYPGLPKHDGRWTAIVEEYDGARTEARLRKHDLEGELYDSLEARDSVPPAAKPPTATQTPAAPKDLLGNLTPEERQDFLEALLRAFPGWSDLEQVFYFELNLNLNEVVVKSALRPAYTEVIQKAIAGGWTHKLLMGARKQNPSNDLLRNFETAVMTRRQPPQQVPAEPFFADSAALQRKLRQVGARIYSRGTRARMLATDAELNLGPINFEQSTDDFWFEMVEEAVKSRKLLALVRIMQKDYPADMDLNMIAHEARLHGLN